MKPVSFPGIELREHREALGLSIYEVFRKTHVPANYIEALERGDIHALPATCYAAGFLKTYCQFLGLNPDRYVDSFRACSRPSVVHFLRRQQEKGFQAPAWMHDFLTWAVITAVVLLAWITYSVVFQPQADAPAKRVAAGTMEVAPPPSGPRAGF